MKLKATLQSAVIFVASGAMIVLFQNCGKGFVGEREPATSATNPPGNVEANLSSYQSLSASAYESVMGNGGGGSTNTQQCQKAIETIQTILQDLNNINSNGLSQQVVSLLQMMMTQEMANLAQLKASCQSTTPPTPIKPEPCPQFECAAPPVGCTTSPAPKNANGCFNGCPTVVCATPPPTQSPPPLCPTSSNSASTFNEQSPTSCTTPPGGVIRHCPTFDCAAPPSGCTYSAAPTDANGCHIGCGKISCPAGSTNNI